MISCLVGGKKSQHPVHSEIPIQTISPKFATMRNTIRNIIIISLISWPLIVFGKKNLLHVNHSMLKPSGDTLVLSQADGTKLHLVCSGSYFLNYCETTDGYTVMIDAIGEYEFAKRGSKGTLIPSGIEAKDEHARDPQATRYVRRLPKHLRYTGETLKLFEDKQKRMDEAPAILKRDKTPPRQ